LWNVKTGECIRTLNGHGGGVNSVSFDGEGLLASGSWDNTGSIILFAQLQT